MVALPLSLACAADAEYIPHCAAMLHSLAVHDDPQGLRIHFLHDEELDERLLAQLGQYAIDLGLGWAPCLVADDVRFRFPFHHRFGRVAWYRVALPELLPDVDRILYLDSDLIVTDSLELLGSIDLGSAALAAVTNPLYPGTSLDFLRELGVPSAHDYFNTGVMLMNLSAWRQEQLGAKLQSFIDRGRGLELWPDQTALNAVLWHRRLPLPPRWNAQNTIFDLRPKQLPFSLDDIELARRSPAVVHFIGPYKPWHHRSKHPLRSLYFDHLDQTPWAGRQIEGATLANRTLRLLPSALGLRVESRIRREIARSSRLVKR